LAITSPLLTSPSGTEKKCRSALLCRQCRVRHLPDRENISPFALRHFPLKGGKGKREKAFPPEKGKKEKVKRHYPLKRGQMEKEKRHFTLKKGKFSNLC